MSQRLAAQWRSISLLSKPRAGLARYGALHWSRALPAENDGLAETHLKEIMTDLDEVRALFARVNGSHPMSAADDEYCRRLFALVPDDDPDYSWGRIHELMVARELPLPTYVLSDGTPMVHPDYLGLLRQAGGPDRLRDWFLAQWSAPHEEAANEAWTAYLDGQYSSLYTVTPRTIQLKDHLMEEVEELATELRELAARPGPPSDRDPAGTVAQLRSAIDTLDTLLPPFTGYDRLRFGGQTPREKWIEEVRATHLGSDDAYRMRISLNVLNHLGINLYSNLPAVLSEAVANAWDADATRVDVDIDPDNDVVTVCDNGIGMTRREINDRYLNVGYRRRDDKRNPASGVTMRGRPVMGRKGIGKLSLFSITKTIEVQSVARRPIGDTKAPLQRSALVLDLDDILERIKDQEITTYRPDEVEPDDSVDAPGTQLRLTRPRKDLRRTAAHLRRRLARRFSMVGDTFEIYVNGDRITTEDRDLAKRCRYLWVYGPADYRDELKALVPKAERIREHDGLTRGGRQIRGWIGSATTSTDLKPEDEQDESLNRIAVLVRGKLAQEDVLEAVAQGGVFSKFLSGEIHADFLDEDEQDDIATSSRQGIVEDDTRFLDFKAFLNERIPSIGTDWNNFREKDGANDARKLVPAIEQWLNGFKGDTKKHATRFIGRVNSVAADDSQRRQLLSSAVIAFERLWRRDRLSEIQGTDDANLPALIEAFKSIDDVEAAMYYDIVQQRLDIIRKFEDLTDQDALESVLRDYLFDHLWLLDPGWDRATESHMETTIAKLIQDGKVKDRVDIKYRTTGAAHVIVELKRADRPVSTLELATQTEKYRPKVVTALRQAHGDDVDVQVVCVVGKDLTDWKNDGGREKSREALRAYSTRVVMYQELVENAKQSYDEYLRANREVGTIRDVLSAMEDQLTKSTGQVES